MTYIIRATHYYYGPGSKTSTVQADGQDAEFPTRAAAKAHVEMLEEGEYRLDHNESSRPTYRIRNVG